MEQAFPFLTVDGRGFPHSALLSRAELSCRPELDRICAVVRSTRTKANLLRTGSAGSAGLIAVEGQTAHHVKLRLVSSLESGEFLGCAFELVEHKADTLGIALEPLRFEASSFVARVERWDVSEELLHRLESEG